MTKNFLHKLAHLNVQQISIIISTISTILIIITSVVLFSVSSQRITILILLVLILIITIFTLNTINWIYSHHNKKLHYKITTQSVKQNLKLLEIIHNMPIGILITDQNHRIIYCSKIYRLYRQDKEIWLGQKYLHNVNTKSGFSLNKDNLITEYQDTTVDGQIILYQNYTTRDRSIISIAIDVTHSQQLMKLVRLRTIELITGHIAHTFSNLLTTINSYGELLQEGLSDNKNSNNKNIGYIREILKANYQGQQLIQYLLKSNDGSRQQAVNIPLQEVWHHMLGLIQASPNPRIKLNVKIHTLPDLQITAYQILLNDLLLNIFLNACDALIDRVNGEINIQIGVQSSQQLQHTLDKDANKYRKDNDGNTNQTKIMMPITEHHDSCAMTYGQLSANKKTQYLVLQITDNGPGIPSRYIHKIFDPFFTANKTDIKRYRYGGSGLGLSTVYSTLDKHQGIMHLITDTKGTDFSFYFPTHAAHRKNTTSTNTKTVRSSSTKNNKPDILIVEDDHAVAQVLIIIVQKAGYKPIRVNDGQEALQLIETKLHKWKLMIIDHIMPGQNGLQIIQKLRKDNFDVPIILCTGFLQEIPAKLLKDPALNIQVLAKPYHNQDLINMIKITIAQNVTKG